MPKSIVYSYDEIPEVIKTLIADLKNCKIITFVGPLGAGKTTIIKALLKLYGVKEDVVSPTFNYMNIYKNDKGNTFIHFDLYRIKTLNEFLMAGFDEYLYDDNNLCLIEWPEIIDPLLESMHSKVCKISINYQENNFRIISF